MTDREYLDLTKKYPFYAEKPYEGIEEDKKAIQDYNRNLTNEFPFLVPHNAWTGEVVNRYDYSYTVLDQMPEGWRVAFGIEMCQKIKDALLKTQEAHPEGGYPESYYTTNYDSDKIIPYLYGYRITEIKEKYGELRWYDNGSPQEVHDIINKYSRLSAKTCIKCGKPAKWISRGWISPYCEDCAQEYLKKEEEYYKDKGETVSMEDYFTPIEEFYDDVTE